MAFKLTKNEIARRDSIVSDLNAAREKLEDAVRVYNAAVEAAREPLRQVLSDYNEVLANARGFVEDIASEAQEQYEGRSDRWRDSDAGSTAREWVDAWQTTTFDSDVEFEFGDDLSEDLGEDHGNDLEELPVEAV